MLKPRLDSVQADASKVVRFAPENSDAPALVSHAEAWQRVCRRLRAEVGEDVFNSWFGRLELDEIHDDVARLSVPTKFLKSWIQSHYSDRIVVALSSEVPHVATLAISVRTSGRVAPARPVEVAAPQRYDDHASRPATNIFAPPSALAPRRESEPVRDTKHLDGEARGGSPLDRRLTFSSFLVG